MQRMLPQVKGILHEPRMQVLRPWRRVCPAHVKRAGIITSFEWDQRRFHFVHYDLFQVRSCYWLAGKAPYVQFWKHPLEFVVVNFKSGQEAYLDFLIGLPYFPVELKATRFGHPYVQKQKVVLAGAIFCQCLFRMLNATTSNSCASKPFLRTAVISCSSKMSRILSLVLFFTELESWALLGIFNCFIVRAISQ